MLLPLVLLFIAVPIAELAVIIQVGQAIGVWWTIGLLIADSLLGAWLMRHQGRATWRRFNEAVGAGRVPTREVLDGALVIFGGALLLTPGFVTDLFGILLLLPPTRALVRAVLVRRLLPRMVVSGFGTLGRSPGGGFGGGAPGPRPGDARPPGGADVEGTATEVDDPRRLP
jgi:UPF0716 protein FxsA